MTPVLKVFYRDPDVCLGCRSALNLAKLIKNIIPVELFPLEPTDPKAPESLAEAAYYDLLGEPDKEVVPKLLLIDQEGWGRYWVGHVPLLETLIEGIESGVRNLKDGKELELAPWNRLGEDS